MVTYLYWMLVITLTLACVYLVGIKLNQWKWAGGGAVGIFLIGTIAYFFHFQQVFVKHYGGVMTITVPEGQVHIGATWKDDNLWIENYDPRTNTCHFREYSKGALLEGQVLIKDCNPLLPNTP